MEAYELQLFFCSDLLQQFVVTFCFDNLLSYFCDLCLVVADADGSHSKSTLGLKCKADVTRRPDIPTLTQKCKRDQK